MKKLIAIIIVLFCINSCQKNTDSNHLTLNSEETFKAKTQLTEWLYNKKTNDTVNNNFIDSLIKILSNSEIHSTSINKFEYVFYVPLELNNNLNGLSFIYNKRLNLIESCFIAVINPESDRLSSYSTSPLEILSTFYNQRNITFNGSISAYDISRKFLWEIKLRDGQNVYTKKITKENQSLSGNIKSNSINTNDTKALSCTAFYLVTYWSDGSVTRQYIGGFCDNCELLGVLTPTGKMEIKSLCGGGGGGGGSSSPVDKTKDVKNNLKEECLKALVNTLLNSTIENKITQILNRTFGQNSTVTLYFEEDYTIPIEASTQPYVIQGTNDITKIITRINPSKFDENASKEYKTVVIMHEVIHAFLDMNPSMLKNLTQHAFMLNNYVDILSTTLQDFFPSMTTDQANSLALYGLGKDVTNSAAFDEALKKYGFDRNGGTTDYSNLAMQYRFGSLGQLCGTKRGV